MTINKFNYEAFALDYLEGNLSVELTEEMERFLRTHPAIEAELSGMMEVVYLEPDTSIVFEDKATLLKEEKVVWLSKRWIRPLVAAASIALLLMTYVVGYQAGVKQVDGVVMTDETDNDRNDRNNSSSATVAAKGNEETTIVKEKLEVPVINKLVEKEATNQVVKSTNKPTPIKKSKQIIEQELIVNNVFSTPDEVIVDAPKVVDNELVERLAPLEFTVVKELIILTPIKTIRPTFVYRAEETNNLTHALSTDVPVGELAGITVQKKKRNIKDFLGRFPVTQLKEALIPTYYKEENAGQ